MTIFGFKLLTSMVAGLLFSTTPTSVTTATTLKAVSYLKPNTFYMRSETLVKNKENPQKIQKSLDLILKKAVESLELNLTTVVDGKLQDEHRSIHDYVSFSPFWWKDTEAPCSYDDSKLNATYSLIKELISDGYLTPWQNFQLRKKYDKKYVLPELQRFGDYVKCDGERNFYKGMVNDSGKKRVMFEVVFSNALAFWYTENQTFAKQASVWAKAWFINEKTRMNPSLQYAQTLPGMSEGRSFGIIEWAQFPIILDAIELLKAGKANKEYWNEDDCTQLQVWLTQFQDWLRYSTLGQLQRTRSNNHGSWYLFLLLDLSLRIKDQITSNLILEEVKYNVIERIFAYNGLLPEEIIRTKSYHYQMYSLLPIARIAMYGHFHLYDDSVFNYCSSQTGVGLMDGVDAMIPYAVGKEEWRYRNIKGRTAFLSWGDYNYNIQFTKWEELFLLLGKFAPRELMSSHRDYLSEVPHMSGYNQSAWESELMWLYF